MIRSLFDIDQSVYRHRHHQNCMNLSAWFNYGGGCLCLKLNHHWFVFDNLRSPFIMRENKTFMNSTIFISNFVFSFWNLNMTSIMFSKSGILNQHFPHIFTYVSIRKYRNSIAIECENSLVSLEKRNSPLSLHQCFSVSTLCHTNFILFLCLPFEIAKMQDGKITFVMPNACRITRKRYYIMLWVNAYVIKNVVCVVVGGAL